MHHTIRFAVSALAIALAVPSTIALAPAIAAQPAEANQMPR